MKYLWNDGWSFQKTPVGTEVSQVLENLERFNAVDIPHDWLIYDSQNLYENGTGWYRKTFTWNKDKTRRAFLTFEGVYMDSTVYVNGTKAFEWKYGYSTFNFEITDYLCDGGNEVVVSVCYQSPNSRWYSGAGIYRDVYFTVTGLTYIGWEDIYISTSRKGGDYVLCADTKVSGDKADYRITHRLLSPAGEECPIQLISQNINQNGSVCEYLVSSPRLWDVESPVLYTLVTSLVMDTGAVQEESSRIGFRTTEFSPERGFILNGRVLKLNGVCEHHDLGAIGAAFNRSAMRRKLVKLKEMGVNAVRGAHNMTAPGLVELADEMGVLLISEAFDMWERPKTAYDYARFFKDYHKRDVESWVKRDRNHASVIMWSIGNEIFDTHADERGQELTRELMSLVHRYDPDGNAAVTIGSNWMAWENGQKCADIVKLAGYNYSERLYRKHHAEHPDWVIYGSETSSIVQSRGVYHFPLGTAILAEDDEQCSALGNSSTSWGARSMEACVTEDRDMDFSMGQFLWTGFDYIGEPTPYHTKNSYFGQLDTAGFPKDSYYVWQAAWTDFRKKPMIHVFPYWDFNEGQQIDVRVCSNCPQAELFLNGKSLGKQRLTNDAGSGSHIIADYSVKYEKGVLLAVAYDESGTELAREERRSFGDSHALVMHAESQEIMADGRDLLFIEVGAADKDGIMVENACDRVYVTVEGEGRLVGLDNGDSTDYDSYKGRSRRMFNGRLLIMVRATQNPGEIRIRADAKGQKSAQLVCRSIEAPVCGGLTSTEENRDLPVVLGKADEIPVRKVELKSLGGQKFTPENKEISVEAVIRPANADDHALEFRVVDANGVKTNLVSVSSSENRACMTALGDGSFKLQCLSKSGTDSTRIISQLEFSIEGLGTVYLDPYDFIYGSQYSYSNGNTSSGNEKGVATARGAETVVSFDGIDFGVPGSDEITVPIFALDSNEYSIQIWEGIPGNEGSTLIGDVVYQKPSKWNVYQPDTWKLNKVLTGVTGISFVLQNKVHIKGFSFTRREKAWQQLPASMADNIYGDSFSVTKDAVEQIGNNVSLVFTDMNFGDEGTGTLVVCGRALNGDNAIHVHFDDGKSDLKQIIEFPQCSEYIVKEFKLERVSGSSRVTFVFMPGSCFDFKWLKFK